MTIEIPSEFQHFIDVVIDRGRYKSASDVIGTALNLLRERESRLEGLRRDVRPALERLDRGEGVEFDDTGLDEFFEKIERQGLSGHESR